MKKYKMYGKDLDRIEVTKKISDYEQQLLQNVTRYTEAAQLVGTGKVLDYGCGWGVFSKMLSSNPKRDVEGIDIDSYSISIAKDIIGESDNLKFCEKKIEDIESNQYDCVISMQVLEHTLNPGSYLAECRRVLNNGGKLVISIPNEFNINFFISQLLISKKRIFRNVLSKEYSKQHDHIMTWSFYNFLRLIRAVGFEYECHKFCEGIPFLKWYIKLKLPFIRNLSYTTIFVLKKKDRANTGI